MKTLIFCLSLVPTFAFAGLYSCQGSGYSIEVSAQPAEMRISGNGYNANAQNVRIDVLFETEITGNVSSPASTLRLKVRDAGGGNPGDVSSASLKISSANGVKEVSGLSCTRGND